MYNRVFTFGCSYTQYSWPTWADMLIRDLGIESHNYGLSGIGNVGIMHEIVKADLVHKFTENDLIVIVWTQWQREDRIKEGRWQPFGFVFNNPFFDKRFLKKYWDFGNDIVKNSTAIISTNKMYSNLIKFQGHISIPGYGENNEDPDFCTEEEKELFNLYLPHIPKTGIFDSKDMYKFDGHPSVEAHLNYLKEEVAPACGIQIKDSTIKHYLLLDKRLRKIVRLRRSRDDITRLVEREVEQWRKYNNETN